MAARRRCRQSDHWALRARAGVGMAANGNAIYAAGLLATDFGVPLPQ